MKPEIIVKPIVRLYFSSSFNPSEKIFLEKGMRFVTAKVSGCRRQNHNETSTAKTS